MPVPAAEPFTLSKAIEKGLDNNLSLVFAKQENRIGTKNMRMKYRKYFPTLNLGYSAPGFTARVHGSQPILG